MKSNENYPNNQPEFTLTPTITNSKAKVKSRYIKQSKKAKHKKSSR
ncbi:MAG: hypothetical protein IJF83_11915 [Methanobrevibacter sp.]|nr:hypothetical protein [Methanobrevibacter sp.]